MKTTLHFIIALLTILILYQVLVILVNVRQQLETPPETPWVVQTTLSELNTHPEAFVGKWVEVTGTFHREGIWYQAKDSLDQIYLMPHLITNEEGLIYPPSDRTYTIRGVWIDLQPIRGIYVLSVKAFFEEEVAVY